MTMLSNPCMNCCGGTELHGMNDLKWTPAKFLRTYYMDEEMSNPYSSTGKAFAVFSYACAAASWQNPTGRSKTIGSKQFREWRAFIEKNELGTVLVSPEWTPNPNMENTTVIRSGIWIPDNKAVKRYIENGPLRPKNLKLKNPGLSWGL